MHISRRNFSLSETPSIWKYGSFVLPNSKLTLHLSAIFTVFSFVFPLVKIAKEKKKKKAEEGQA